MKPPFCAKTFSVAILAAALSAPLASHADAAVDACIDAFIASTLPEGHPIKIRKTSLARSPMGSYGPARNVEVVARVSRTGERVAQATCVLDTNGRVIALNGAPSKSRVAGALEKTAAR